MVPINVYAGKEMAMGENDNGRINGNWNKRMHVFGEKLRRFPSLAWQTAWKVGREDPRRAIHAFKVGCSLTLASLLYLLEPFYNGIGQSAIWAVMTVVVVLEFTAGKSSITIQEKQVHGWE